MSRPTVTRVESRRRTPPRVAVLAALGTVVALDYAAFRFLFKTNYFGWYLHGGPLIATVLTGVSKAFDLDDDPTRISADPNRYTAAWFQRAGMSLLNMSAIERSREASFFDSFAASIVLIGMALIGFAWLVVIAPIQYFVTLLTGAPARVALGSTTGVSAIKEGDTTTIITGPVDPPSGAKPVGLLKDNAVTVTSAITAGFLFLISKLI